MLKEAVLHISQNRKMSPILTLFAILERCVVKTYFMNALLVESEFCEEGKHYFLGCNESGKKLLKKNCSVYEHYQFCILTQAELRYRKKAHVSYGS